MNYPFLLCSLVILREENFTDKIFTRSKQTNIRDFDSLQISHLLLQSAQTPN